MKKNIINHKNHRIMRCVLYPQKIYKKYAQYEHESFANISQKSKFSYSGEPTIIYHLLDMGPPLKYCLFGIADPHYQQVGR
jgi:hypothetical protein